MTVCVYIMFWAKTRPRPEETTDFGEMWPVIVFMKRRRVFELGCCLANIRT